MVQYNLNFLGTTVVNKLFSNPMVPWIIADVKKRKKIQKVSLIIENGEIIGKTDGVTIFHHHTSNLARFYPEPKNSKVFMYLIRVDYEPVLNMYLFEAPTIEDVVEIFHSMRDSTKEHNQSSIKCQNNEATLTSLCPDISPTNSQFFEVLYVGKMKVSHRKVPETFVDEALERIRLYELEKSKKLLEQMNDDIEKGKSCSPLKEVVNNQSPANELSSNYDKKNRENKMTNDKCDDTNNLSTLRTGEKNLLDKIKFNNTYGRARAGSMGVIETFKKKFEDANQNRTLLFYVGQTDLRLISPDRKQVVLHKTLKDIHCCVQGIQNSLHFAIIGREIDSYVSYVFKCESEGVAEHIVSAISQSYTSLKDTKEKKKQPLLSCEHCPMVWYHKLCAEVEGQSEKKTQLAIFKKIETLPEQEQTDIHTKFLGAESSDIKEQNEFLMILLRTHCERKQSRHIHDTAETRSEFLNQVLGGNTIFMKAKRSLTNSFDHLLKRKGSQTDILNSKDSTNGKWEPIANIDDECNRSYITVGSTDGESIKKEISKQLTNIENLTKFHKETSSSLNDNCQDKNLTFEDIAAIAVNNKKIEKSILSSNEMACEIESPKTPMINIFLKVGSSSKSPPYDNVFSDLTNQTPSRSWRQAIFNRVLTPGKVEFEEKFNRKKTKKELRQLWKTAINQQILLIRMEKENALLKANQEEATVKRIKLEYDELGTSKKEFVGFWDTLFSKDNKISPKCDQILFEAVKQGVPRGKRGDVWQFLAFRYNSKQEPFDFSCFPRYNVPYENLLKQLTSFQHCILIDLGRTFPNHPYFSSPLGPGQLSLFNLLKGYSLLDPQVGYCQGLSFVAGVLLLHMSEDSAFSLLKHLMFVRNLRNQYLPDMTALQVQLYQLTRLIHDTLPQLYSHFDKNEIAPTLYATSWMLTLFASQFPLGFVTRVFDLLFLEQTTEVLFKVIMALLEEHAGAILRISGFEEIMNYLKSTVTAMDSACVERIMKKVLSLNISKQLHDFEIEYHILQEEMSSPRPELDQLKKLKLENKQLIDENLAYKEKLEAASRNIARLEKLKFSQQATINNLEADIKNLELTARFLGDFIVDVSDEHKYVNVPLEIRRLIKNLESNKQNNKKITKKEAFDKTAFFKRIQSSIDFYERPHYSELCTAENLCDGAKNGTLTKDEKSVSVKGKTDNSQEIKVVPLKVIIDDNDDEKKNFHHSPKLTSKITSGVSSFFNSSHSQINKNQKNKKFLQENSNNNLTKNAESFEQNFWKENKFSNEIESFNLKKSVDHSQLNEKILTDDSVCQTKKSEVITENMESDSSNNFYPKDKTIHFHPLDSCEDVNITYNGTTQLKSIKSGGHKPVKNAAIDLIPVNNNQFLHISENDVS